MGGERDSMGVRLGVGGEGGVKGWIEKVAVIQREIRMDKSKRPSMQGVRRRLRSTVGARGCG